MFISSTDSEILKILPQWQNSSEDEKSHKGICVHKNSTFQLAPIMSPKQLCTCRYVRVVHMVGHERGALWWDMLW